MYIDGKHVPVIALANQKGGVAKTTTADALACMMRSIGLRVLVVDMDHQGSMGQLEERYVAPGEPSASAFLKGADVVVDADGQATVPGEFDLVTAMGDVDMDGNEIGVGTLRSAIERACRLHGFDVAIVDTHPGIGEPEIASVAAATHIIVPTTANRLGSEAISSMAEFLDMVQGAVETDWEDVPAVLITQYRGMTRVERDTARTFVETLPEIGFRLFAHRIPVNVSIENAQVEGRSIFDDSVLRGAALEYKLVTKAVLGWIGLPDAAGMLEDRVVPGGRRGLL